MNNRYSRVLLGIVLSLGTALIAGPVLAQTTVAGTTPGQFSVNESGAATYSIPIQVPPGVAGMQPQLSFEYNSQRGNGMLGVGWSLSGLSAITRCPRTMAQDSIRGSVNSDMNDRFCMGGQRLMLVSGSYGADNSEYRTERESFSKIHAFGAAGAGPLYFVVKTKAGLTMEYGNTVDSRVLNQLGTVVRIWTLNKMTDAKANTLTVSYDKSADNSVQVPTNISYGGNVVRFEYDATRPDKSLGYVTGSLVQMDRRITNIKTYVGGGLVKNHWVAYENGQVTGRSRLLSITECSDNAASICLLPTMVSGPAEGVGWTTPQSQGGLHGAGTAGMWFVDVNGDGLSDYVTKNGDGCIHWNLSTGTGWTAPQSQCGLHGAGTAGMWFVDVNGDGLSDYVTKNGDGSIHWDTSVYNSTLLSSVSNGLGAVTTITHKPLTDNTVYTKDSSPNAAVYPKVDLQYPQYVVSTVSTSNGLGGVNTVQYSYGGLKAEQGTGRGLLGFRWMKSKSVANNIESYTEFNQTYPFTGSVTKNETRLAGSGNAGLLKRTINTYAQSPGSAGTSVFVYPSQSVEESWDLSGTPYPSSSTSYVYGQTPQYGDPTQITVSNSEGSSKTTVNEYWPVDSNNWILGRLKKASVTSVKP